MLNYNKDTEVNESEFEDLREYDEITDTKTIHKCLGDPIILNHYKTTNETLLRRIVDVAALCWNNEDKQKRIKLQRTEIKFKVDESEKVTRSLPLNKFMLSIIFLRPIFKYIDDLENIDDFLVVEELTNKRRGVIQDNIVQVLIKHGENLKAIQHTMASMSLDLKELLLIFSHADMQIFTAENLFLDHYRDSKLIQDINNTEYSPDTQTADIIEENAKKCELLTEEMIKRNNPFFMCNKYTQIIKPKQLEELYINFSQIPDGKNLIPVIMNGNGFKAGYHDMDVLYAGAIAAKVPDILNEKYMGSAGYFNRNLMILTYGTISKTVYDCGSVNPLPEVVDEDILEMFDGRYYYDYKGSPVLKVLHHDDKHLIGKTLWFRSPCTCNLNEDVCHVCYGSIALKVADLKGGFIYTTELMTSKISKNILSVKHIMKANAEKIEFSKGFDNYFMIESSAIVPNEEKKFDIYLPENYLDNISDSLTIYIGKELRPLTISHYANIHISDQVIDKMKEVIIEEETYYKISSYKILELGGVFCSITPINVMKTQQYLEIMKLFESKITKYDKIEDVILALMKLLKGTIPLLSVHGEIILSKHLRSVDNRLLRPNFLEEDAPYQMMCLSTALKNSESVTTALSFEKTNYHLLNEIFDERNKINRVGPRSFADFLFGEETL